MVVALIPDFYWFYTINDFSFTKVSAKIGTEELRISRAFSGPEAFRETKKKSYRFTFTVFLTSLAYQKQNRN